MGLLDHDRLDRFKFHPDDRGDREHLQTIQWKQLSHDGDDRSDPNVFQNAPVMPRFNALSALRFKKCISKWHNKTLESGDEALAPVSLTVYGTVSGKISVILHYDYSFLKEINSVINRLPLELYALFYRTPAKIMLPPQAQNVLFETIETVTWKPKIASIVPIVRIASKHF